MNTKFNVGQNVMVKFNCKWTVGKVEMISFKAKEVIYHISVAGAKHFKKVAEDKIW